MTNAPPPPLGDVTTQPARVSCRGVCHVMFAYDAGFSIDLERAQGLIAGSEGASREVLTRRRPAPSYFAFDPPPVRIAESTGGLRIGGFETEPVVECVLFDFGAVSVSYRVPVEGSLEALLELSLALNENHDLLLDSRRRVEAVMEKVRGAVSRLGIADFVEDYFVFELSGVGDGSAERAGSDGSAAERLVREHAAMVAKILRCERRELSSQEIEDALACRVSYSGEDLALVDWNAALVIDREPEDVRSVLEFANVELLEMRHLDHRLDDAMEQAYESVSKRPAIFPSAGSAGLRRIAELQADSVQLFESVNNALKLIGDQYLARVYRVAAQRLHLPEWDASILRKIDALESVYEKLSDRRSNRRMEVLEWIIIILIAFEIVWAMVK